MTPDEFRADPEMRRIFYDEGLDCHSAPMDAEGETEPAFTIDDIESVLDVQSWNMKTLREVGAVVGLCGGRWAFMRKGPADERASALVSTCYDSVAHLASFPFLPMNLDELAFRRDLVLPPEPDWPTDASGIVVVSGSRVLADNADATFWARGMITALFAWLGPRVGTLVVGDASGPDTWATMACEGTCVVSKVYGLNGAIMSGADVIAARERGGRPSQRLGTWGTRTDDFTPKTWPLERNRVMAEHVGRRVLEGRKAVLLALGASWSRTNGTRHTADRAREAGIPVCQFDYPQTQPWPVIP